MKGIKKLILAFVLVLYGCAASSVYSTTTVTTAITAFTPTLLPDEGKEKVAELIRENVDCAKPCFFGVLPDKTTNSELQNIFDYLNYSLHGPINGNYSAVSWGHMPPANSEIAWEIQVYVEDDIVRGLQTRLHHLNADEVTTKDWDAFTIKNVLNLYGVPSKVEFWIWTIHEGDAAYKIFWYEVIIRYDDINLILQYMDASIKPENNYEVCPNSETQGFNDLWIWMGEKAPNPPIAGVPLETATSITKQEFYDLWTSEQPEIRCFNLDISAFTP